MRARWFAKMPVSSRWAAGTIAVLLAGVLGDWAWSGSAGSVSATARAVHFAGSAPSGWSAPELIRAYEVGTPGPPQQPAFDANGDAVAVWTELSRPTNETIAPAYLVRAAVRLVGGHWQPADTLSRLGLSPEVASDTRGDAIAVWESPSGVQAAMRPAGGGWLAAQTVLTPGGEQPQIASDPSGDAIVVSTRQVPGHSTGIQAALRLAGGSFSAAQIISLRENAFHPRIAMNASGDAFVAWESDSSRVRGCPVRGAYLSAHGQWSTSHTLSDKYADCPANQRVAIDERGDAVVVWLAQRGATTFVETAGRTADGRWTPRRIIGEGPSIEEPPQIGMDARGDTLVVWSEPALLGGRVTLWARIRPAGRRWEAARRITHANGGPPSLAIDARGDALLAWQDKRGIEAAARPAGRQWQHPYTVSGHNTNGGGEDPLAALDAQGDGMVAWQNHEGIKTAWHSSLFP